MIAKTEIPVGIEAAAHRFAAACLRDGWTDTVVLTCYCGTVSCLTDASAGSTTYTLVDGDWHEVKEVG